MTMFKIVSFCVTLLYCAEFVRSADNQLLPGSGTGNDRATALAAAKQAAIGSLLSEILSAPAGAGPTDSLARVISARLAERLEEFEIVKEGVQAGQYHLDLNVERDYLLGLLVGDRKSSGEVLGLSGRPRMLILVSEEIDPYLYVAATGNVETLLASAFFEREFKVVDQQQVNRIRTNDQARMAANGDAGAAQDLGRMFKADCIITGKATAVSVSGSYGLKSVRTDLNVRVVRVDTGELLGIAQVNTTKAQTSYETAIRVAFEDISQKGADKIMAHIIQRWRTESKGGNPITIQVSGLDYGGAAEFESWMSAKIDGVGEVTLISFEGLVAEYELDYAGQAGDLAKIIAREQNDALAIASVTGNKIVMLAK